ncbi:MAG: HAD family hydrolase, partial [Patescibacteria group bacterium]|nr:HAD family hydrolase [Patescibacteria group bacterium]
MTAYSKKLIAFDLDGTLTESKAPIDKEMADLFVQLLARKKVAVIGGGGWPQFQSQFIAGLPASADNLSNLLLLPTSGTCLYVWKGNWVPEYQETLSQIDRDGIRRAFDSALKAAGYDKPEKQYGDIIEDRGSQVTFSALGQKAPIELKRQWDPDREKRRKIAAILAEK